MKRKRFSLFSAIVTLATVIVAVAWIFPLYWALNTALSVDTQTIKIPPVWFPHPMIFDSFVYVIKNTSIARWYFNSVFSSVAIVVAVLFITMMCAYAISQIRFPGRHILFVIFLAGFMVPAATNVVPLFMFLNKMNMVNTYWGLILPQLVSPVAVVIYKQFFDQMPPELTDAAHMDGAGELRLLFTIFFPLNLGVTWALAIVLFIWSWNNFFWPFIIISSTPMMTIPVGITQVQSWYGIAYPRVMASAVLAALPTAILYLIFQKRVAQGVAVTAGIK
ncbi:MAG TPA: carbohydrate ABC transporter permease [Spirochaetia bacterium]|nr:carbohydrate ABC transporter permease [Spirochaetia bacterium]